MTDAPSDLVETPEWALSYAAVSGGRRAAFHGLYRGDLLGNPRRGLAVVLTEAPDARDVARETAALAAHGFAEGYFGAAPTLSAARAAGHALDSINAWLFGQAHNDPERAGMRAGFGALLLIGRRLGIATLGEERVLRWRDGQVSPLMPAPAELGMPPLDRALGAARGIALVWRAETAQPGDRYLIATPGIPAEIADAALAGPGTPAERLHNLRNAVPDGALLLVDLHRLPEASLDDIALGLGALPVRPPPQEGETLDGFIIGRTLYRSRYTLLRRAVDTVGRREVVLKFPLPAMAEDRVFQAGFAREAWIGRAVRSPFIADYIDLPAARQSCLYIALPYYRGETLERRLLRRPRIGFAEGLGIALRLAAAVQDLDRFQVIHRDLKPENVILPEAGGLRLLDLGLAYLPGLDDSREDRLGGTTRYMAPELFAGAPAGAKTEVYALGTTIYRLFSGGALAFSGREVRPLRQYRPDLPEWLGRCIGQALAHDPALRFADAAAFAAALEAGLLHGEAPVTAAYWRRRLDDPRPWQILTALLALALMIVLWRTR